ncbi:esterase FE4-like [Lycorma delicatula]|uniref:esterase FE4-like n=1 Tax=Lycorma delicatula TaxID=130591 RepID=UPI003F51A99A
MYGMYLFYFLIIHLLLGVNSCVKVETGPLVCTPQGRIKGTWKTTINGRLVEAYLRIPYAKPPIGSLRFKNPEPAVTPWEGIRDGTKEPSVCIQTDLFHPSTEALGSEDCLYLNVYTPASICTRKFPVMVFLHGGAFISGSGVSELYGPDILLDKDVILVTVNSRLGIPGFASTEDKVMPGNFGLKDQVLALKWIKSNIHCFGGNPDSITLFGESSGAASVHFHMLSPLSKGLFHRSILMSGSAWNPWAISPRGSIAKKTLKLGTLLNCSYPDSKKLVECLRRVPANNFISVLFNFSIWDGFDPFIVFKPVFEPENVADSFITLRSFQNPTTLPMMLGVTTDEGAFKLAQFFGKKQGIDALFSQINQKWLKIAPAMMFYEDSASDLDNVSISIRNYYFKNHTIDKNVIPDFVNMISDSWFLRGILPTIRQHQGTGYAYLFAHSGQQSVTQVLSNSTFMYGACHMDDLLYLFPMKNVKKRHGFTETDRKVSETMVKLFTNFAIHGLPNTDDKPVKWNPISKPDYEYFFIQHGKYKIKKNYLRERNDFWSGLQWRNNLFQ